MPTHIVATHCPCHLGYCQEFRDAVNVSLSEMTHLPLSSSLCFSSCSLCSKPPEQIDGFVAPRVWLFLINFGSVFVFHPEKSVCYCVFGRVRLRIMQALFIPTQQIKESGDKMWLCSVDPHRRLLWSRHCLLPQSTLVKKREHRCTHTVSHCSHEQSSKSPEGPCGCH